MQIPPSATSMRTINSFRTLTLDGGMLSTGSLNIQSVGYAGQLIDWAWRLAVSLRLTTSIVQRPSAQISFRRGNSRRPLRLPLSCSSTSLAPSRS
jgi:hypothetical protein